MSHVSGSLSGGGEALNGSGLEAGSVLQTPYMNPTIAALNGGNRVGGGGGDGGETMSNSTLGNSNSNSNSESSPTSRKAYENEYDTPP